MYFRSQKKSAGDVSLSDSIDTDGEGNDLYVMDVLAQEDDMLESISAGEMRRQLTGYIDTYLSKREADIIRMRYGLGGTKPKTQREVALECGISRSYVSRIEKRALQKLRDAMEE